MNTIFPESKLKYCKYCNSNLKEVIYEIIEFDKVNYFNRYFCGKCLRMFHFREPTSKPVKKEKAEKLKQTTKKTKVKKNKYFECLSCQNQWKIGYETQKNLCRECYTKRMKKIWKG